MSFRRGMRLVRVGTAAGVVYMYYEYGLWKDAEQTIRNYEALKKDANGLLDSLHPAIKSLAKDIKNYGESSVSPATEAVSKFRKEWLDFDLAWLRNKDGIVKPTWNKAVGFTCDSLAHLPGTAKDFSISTYNKASEYMNSSPISHTPTTISSPSISSEKQTQVSSGESIQH